MTNHQGRTHTYVQLYLVAKLAGNHLLGSIRDGNKAVDKQAGNARYQFHYGTHFHTQNQDVLHIVSGQQTYAATHYHT